MKGSILKGIAFILMLALLGSANAVSAQAKEILALSAGISPCVEEIMEAFVAQGGKPLFMVKGATAKLAYQIDNGAPYDIFLSADPKWRKWLGREDINSTLRFALLLSCLYGGPVFSEGDSILHLSDVVLAVSNPKYTAYGGMAKEYLVAGGLWEEGLKEGRFVFCDNVPQCVVLTKSGAARGALIPVSTAKKAGGSYTVLDEVGLLPTEVILLNKDASSNVLDFVGFLFSEEAKMI